MAGSPSRPLGLLNPGEFPANLTGDVPGVGVGTDFAAAVKAVAPSAPLSVTNAGTLVAANVTALNFVTNISGTVGAPGTVDVNASGGGGGGGSYVGDTALGIGIVTNSGTGTIYGTGTLVQPASTGTTSLGITLDAGAINYSGTDTAYGGYISQTAGYVTVTNDAGTAQGGAWRASSGGAYVGTVGAGGSQIEINIPIASAETAVGSGIALAAAGAFNAVTNSGGQIEISAGSAAQSGGGIALTIGTGATNGNLTVTNLATADPSVLGAFFRTSVATVGYVVFQSQG